MKSEPETQVTAAAAGRDHLRTSHADREQVIDVLKVAFVQGRLTKDEFEARIAWALTSRTYAELAAVTADVPVGLTGVDPVSVYPPGRRPARARVRVPLNAAVTGGACVTLTINFGMLAAMLSRSAIAVIALVIFTVVATIAAVGAMVVAR